MAKKVSYKVVARHSKPGDNTSMLRYYARAKSNGDISINEMAHRMQLECTLTKADILAVMAALENVIIDSLKSGEIVRLAELGSLSISLKSKGADLEKEFNSSLIKGAHILFRPGKALSSFLKELSYTKINPYEEPEVVDEGQEDDSSI